MPSSTANLSLLEASWRVAQSYYMILVLVLCFAAFIIRGVYNRYFHPLHRFPGPFWGSVTDFYKFYMITTVPTFGLQLHKKYGWSYAGVYWLSYAYTYSHVILRSSGSTSTKPAVFQ